MTPEEKQKLEQIRTRWNGNAPFPSLTQIAHADIKALLSLVDSLEAGDKNPVGWISCGLV